MFRMSINGIQMNDLPKDLNDSKIKIVRDSKLKFLSAQYIADLTFFGDAYQSLVALSASNDGCGFIPAVIQKKCGQLWSTYFSGVIDISSFTHNLSRCWIKANIEDENLLSLILKRKSIKVSQSADFSLTGSAIAPVTAYNLDISNKTITSTDTRASWKVFDIMRHIVQYITDGQVDLVSDFFQITTSQQEKYAIVQNLTGSAAYRFTDAFDQLLILGIPNPPAYTIGDLAEAFSFSSGTFDYNREFMSAVVTGANNIELTSPLPYNFPNAGTLFSSNTKIQSIVYGGKDLMITNGEWLRAGGLTTQIIVSFEQLFSQLDKIFNLSFRMERVGSQIFMRLEPIEYFFTNSNVLAITNIPELLSKKNNEFSFNFITTGDKEGVEAAFIEQSWASNQNCPEDGIDITTEFISDPDLIDAQVLNANDDKDEDLYFLESFYSGTPGLYRTTNYYLTKYTAGVLTFVYNIKNAFLDDYHRIIYHMFGSGGHYTREGRTMTNTSSTIFAAEIEFDKPLNESEIQSLLSGQTDFISFADGRGNSGDGWILEIEIENRSGHSHFKLLTE